MRAMRANYVLAAAAVLLVACMVGTTYADATATWSNGAQLPTTTAAIWSTGSNWTGGTAASGVGQTAYFNNNTIGSGNYIRVVLSGNQTIGNMYFDDLATTKGSWVLRSGGTLAINLSVASGVPIINVGSGVRVDLASSTCYLTGTQGLDKTGHTTNGKLRKLHRRHDP